MPNELLNLMLNSNLNVKLAISMIIISSMLFHLRSMFVKLYHEFKIKCMVIYSSKIYLYDIRRVR